MEGSGGPLLVPTPPNERNVYMYTRVRCIHGDTSDNIRPRRCNRIEENNERTHGDPGGDEKMKLYWRYKKDGKWTWKVATEIQEFLDAEGVKWAYRS